MKKEKIYAVYRENSPYHPLRISKFYLKREAVEEMAQRINKIINLDKQVIQALLQQENVSVWVGEEEVLFTPNSINEVN